MGSKWLPAIAIAVLLVLMLPMLLFGVIGGSFMLLASGSGQTSYTSVCSVGSAEGMTGVPAPGSSTMELNAQQVQHAVTIIAVGSEMQVSQHGVLVALMVALRESTLRNLANPVVPESLDLPHDGLGHDADSVNVFQQRPSANWGSVDELMDPRYAARAFFGGDAGPNQGSPRGLLDIPGWEQLGLGEAGQAVQISAHPEAYDQWRSTAEHLLSQLSGSCGVSADGWVLPSTAPVTSPYGYRVDPINGSSVLHAGTDFSGGCGTPIYAAAAGTVTRVFVDGYGGWIVEIDHGGGVMTWYVHSYPDGIFVDDGDVVDAGQRIAEEGNTGYSTGCHLHFEVHVNGQPVDPMGFLRQQGVDV